MLAARTRRRLKLIRGNSRKFRTDTPHVQYRITRGGKGGGEGEREKGGRLGGDIFSVFPSASLPKRRGRFENINQKLECRIGGNPTSDFITRGRVSSSSSRYLRYRLSCPRDIDYSSGMRSSDCRVRNFSCALRTSRRRCDICATAPKGHRRTLSRLISSANKPRSYFVRVTSTDKLARR